MNALFVPVSQNAKTGPIPATITERGSCWSGCALYEKGCYAFYGALGHFWSGVSEGTRGGSWDELCAKVAALPKRTLWRYAQAGDLPGADDAIDAAAAVAARDREPRQAGHRLHPQAGLARHRRWRRATGPSSRSPTRSGSRSTCRPTTPRKRTRWPIWRSRPSSPSSRMTMRGGRCGIGRKPARRMGRDDRRMARPHRPPAAAHAGGKAHRDLSGDLHERHLQELWRLRRAA